MVGSGAMTAYGIVARPGTEFDAVRLATADAARQMSAISGHVPKALASVTLQHAVRKHVRGFGKIAPVVCRQAL